MSLKYKASGVAVLIFGVQFQHFILSNTEKKQKLAFQHYLKVYKGIALNILKGGHLNVF